MQSLVRDALSLGDGRSAEEFRASLSELLAKVGLSGGGRHERGLAWALDAKVGSIQAMHSLLLVQPARWRAFLDACAPTKSFHKVRLQMQLKRASGGGTTGGAISTHATSTVEDGLRDEVSAQLYWRLLDQPDEEAGGGGLAGSAGNIDSTTDVHAAAVAAHAAPASPPASTPPRRETEDARKGDDEPVETRVTSSKKIQPRRPGASAVRRLVSGMALQQSPSPPQAQQQHQRLPTVQVEVRRSR